MDFVTLEPGTRVPGRRRAVAIGNFDGVHRGHQALVAAAVARAREMGGDAAALTFDPHPVRVLKPEAAPGSLMTLDQKASILDALGLSCLAVLPFTAEVARLEPAEFAGRYLRDALAAAVVVVGADFRFGRDRRGDVAELHDLGPRLGFGVHEVAAVIHDGTAVSSTRVREAVADGRVGDAAALLGRWFFVEGEVVRGAGRGRTLGIPTANVQPRNELLPRTGVYAAVLTTPGPVDARWPAVVNLGRNPTFGVHALSLEAHVLGEPGDLYDRRVRVEFVDRLRDERRFDGPEGLVAQIHEDIARARAVLVAELGL